MNAWKLRLSMVATLSVIFGLTTLVFTAVLLWAGIGFSLVTIGALVVVLNVVQWLLSPYLVGAIYRVKEMKEGENPKLHQMVAELSKKSGISTPKLMLSQIPLPNAFAYGSPITGSRVAVTQGLLTSLDDGEVEAVIGHELGHLKHRDVQVMMVVSFLPALFYYIGYSLMLSGLFSGGDRRNESGSSALFGIAFMAFSWVLTLFTLYLSRLREYYADRHSARIVENGAQKLSTGLVTIVEESKNQMGRRKKEEQKGNTAYKALFIADPDTSTADSAQLHANRVASKEDLLRETLAKKPSSGDSFIEIFSTHPNIIKRLRALQELSENPSTY
jgi:heat shock protein HtpX